MPIYEYRCGACGEVSSFFVRSVSASVDPVCKTCGGGDMRRLISKVAFRVASGDSSGADYYGDPSNIGRRAEESFDRFGVEMPEPVRRTIDDARRGNMPDGLDL